MRTYTTVAATRRQVAVMLLGIASGLPLALTGQAMQAWLTVDGVDVATIGFLGLVGMPYTFKFLWAPLMDRFELPWLGRRRGWLVITQLSLALALVCCAFAMVCLPVGRKRVAPVRQSRLTAVAVALVCGGLSALAATCLTSPIRALSSSPARTPTY